MLVIGAVRPNAESLRVQTNRLELCLRALLEIPGEQSEHDVGLALEGVQQLGDAGQGVGVALWCAQLFVEAFDVAFQQQFHPCVDAFVAVAGQTHELAHDLRIGLAIEMVIRGPRGPEHLAERAMDRAPSRSIGQQERTIDVEENELHVASEAGTRVNSTPLTMMPAPSTCQLVGLSPSDSHATKRAISGWRFP